MPNVPQNRYSTKIHELFFKFRFARTMTALCHDIGNAAGYRMHSGRYHFTSSGFDSGTSCKCTAPNLRICLASNLAISADPAEGVGYPWRKRVNTRRALNNLRHVTHCRGPLSFSFPLPVSRFQCPESSVSSLAGCESGVD